MSKEDRISPKQVVFLLLTCILATVDIFLPAQVAQIAGRDAWISALVAPVLGYLMYRIILLLSLLFPQQSLAALNKILLGKYLGGLLTLLYIASFILLCTSIVVQFSIIIGSAFKPESLPYIWHLVILIPALYVTSLGISVPARMNEALLPLGLFLLFAVVFLNIPEIDVREYLPIFEKGYLPALKGTVLTASKLCYAILILALMPYVNKQEKLVTLGLPGFFVIGIALLVGTSAIAMFGPKLTAITLLPALQMIRNIDIGFLSRLDVLMIGIWYSGFFIFTCAYSFGAASLTRDLFGFKNYRPVLWLYGIIILIIANAKLMDVPYIRMLLGIPLTILLLTLSLGIPLLLYLLARLRGYPKRQPKAGEV